MKLKLSPDCIKNIKLLRDALLKWSRQESHNDPDEAPQWQGWHGSLIPVFIQPERYGQGIPIPEDKPISIYEEVLDCLESFDRKSAKIVREEVDELHQCARKVDQGKVPPVLVQRCAADLAQGLGNIAQGKAVEENWLS